MNAYHVIAYTHYGEDDGKGTVSRSTNQSHFLVICESEENCIGLIKEAVSTEHAEFDKYTIEKSDEILNRPVSDSEQSEKVYSL